MNRESKLKECFSFIDLTSLNSTDTDEKIIQLVQKVNNFKSLFPEIDNVAAICVHPNFASIVKSNLRADDVKIAVVGGGFPASQTFLDVKLLECKYAVSHGADEVDIVIALNKFLAGDLESTALDIKEIKKLIGDKHLKVILETGVLNDVESIKLASRIAIENGADFIKTSTGKVEPAATPQAAKAMCEVIAEYYKATGKKIGFKPAGGIVTTDEAIQYYDIVNETLSKEWLTPELFRIGASRLANNILSELENKPIKYF